MSERPTRKEAKADGERISSGFDGYPQSAGSKYQEWRNKNPNITLGWRPACGCVDDSDHNGPFEPVPQTVLDPFNGSGTTGAVSVKHGRNYIGIELNPDYIKLTRKRLEDVEMVMPL